MIRIGWLLALALMGLCGCGKQSSQPSLRVDAAASLSGVIEQLGNEFAEQHHVRVQYNFASSGTLARQLMARPQADVFLSANQHWMDAVEAKGLLSEGSRQTLIQNTLLVVARKDAAYEAASPNALFGQDFAYCVVGDPAHVPVGQYARNWLQSLGQWDGLQNRLSPAPDATAVIAQVLSRKDLIGIIYQSDSVGREDELKILYALPAEQGPRIEYPVAIIENTEAPELASAFIQYLQRPQADQAFREAGFTTTQ